MNSTNHQKIPRSLAKLLLRRLLFAYLSFALLITGIQMLIEYHMIKQDIVNNLQSLAQTFSPGAESALWDYQEALLKSMVSGIGANPAVVSVDISDTNGGISASWRASSGHQASPALTVQQVLYHNDGDGLKVLGNLRIASSDSILMSRLIDTLWSVGISSSAIFLCLGLLLWLLARSLIVKPLVYFSEQVSALSLKGQGKPIDLGRVEVSEIETLKQGFNQLMQQLATSHARIAEQNVLLQYEKISLKRESEKNLALLRNASDGIHILDTHGNIIEASDSFCAMLGYQREEVIGMNVSQWDARLSDSELFKIITQQFAKPDRSLFETRHRRKDGTVFDVEVSGFPLELDGQPVLFNSSRDITERKKNEIELRIAATAFQSESSIMITDANTVILRVNHAFTETTGYTPEEAVGQTPHLLKSGRHDAEFYRAMWESIHRTGTWQGEIWDRRKNGEIYPKWLTISAVHNEDGVVTHYVGSHIDITERKAAEEKILRLAFYDHLTELPNRLLLLDRLKQALVSSARSNRKGSLLFIDLDNFKNLNDTLGHDIGDLLLQQVSLRLGYCLRQGDTVARLGGDEFVVMLLDLSEQSIEAAAQTEAIGEKILAALSQPYELDKHIHRCTASVGVTLFNGSQQTTDELMKQADIAMYQAKKAGRNTLRFFDRQMQENISARVSLEGELLRALEFEQFHLYYQIQVDSSHRRLGAEALIRWIHPERGLVSPAQCIPLAEESGLILQIGQWVIETACAQIKAWQLDALTRNFVLAVNVSANQFNQDDFIAQVQAVLQRHAINPKLLKLELTESLLLGNIENVITTMNALKEIGVQFSLDDFGTGYSSLQYLKRLPFDQIKIDQSFVRDIAFDSNDKAIVRTIIAMAQSLDLEVIAEGVETEEQRQLLLHDGCKYFQGYHFGKPIPIEQFNAQLKQG